MEELGGSSCRGPLEEEYKIAPQKNDERCPKEETGKTKTEDGAKEECVGTTKKSFVEYIIFV